VAVREETTTVIPSEASRCAIERPIPRPPPVTTATRAGDRSAMAGSPVRGSPSCEQVGISQSLRVVRAVDRHVVVPLVHDRVPVPPDLFGHEVPFAGVAARVGHEQPADMLCTDADELTADRAGLV